MKTRRIIRNSAHCLKCDDKIESTHRHDFRSCKCGALAVDGGHDYLRRLFKDADWLETSLAEDSDDGEDGSDAGVTIFDFGGDDGDSDRAA